jgi:hypothetical protein
MWKFSIRDLMLVTVIAAVSLMWWLDRRRLQEANAALLQANRQVETDNQRLQRKLRPLLLHQLDRGMLLDPAIQRSRLKGRTIPQDD